MGMIPDDDGKQRFQGLRPLFFGDLWDAMTPRQRRRAFWSDLAVALMGMALIAFFMEAAPILFGAG